MASKTIINRKKYIRRPIPPRTNNAVVTTELIHSIVKVAVSDAVNEKFDTLNEKLDKIVSGQQKNSEIKDVDVRLAELRGRKDYRKIILRCVHQVTGYHCKLGVSITQQEGDSVRITQDEIKKRLPFIEDDVIYALIQQYLKNTHEDESLQEIAPPGLQKVAPGDENDFEDESEDEAATNSSTTKKINQLLKLVLLLLILALLKPVQLKPLQLILTLLKPVQLIQPKLTLALLKPELLKQLRLNQIQQLQVSMLTQI